MRDGVAKIAVQDADFHRCYLWDFIEASNYSRQKTKGNTGSVLFDTVYVPDSTNIDARGTTEPGSVSGATTPATSPQEPVKNDGANTTIMLNLNPIPGLPPISNLPISERVSQAVTLNRVQDLDLVTENMLQGMIQGFEHDLWQLRVQKQ